MRSIGELDTADQATRFCDYLLTIGIEAKCEPAGEDPFGVQEIWVRDEERLDASRAELALFRSTPNDARYSNIGRHAEKLRSERQAENQRRRKFQKRIQYRGAQDTSGRGFSGNLRSIPVTITVILLCVAATFATNMGNPSVKAGAEAEQKNSFDSRLFDALSFVKWQDYLESNQDPMASIRNGQLWRLITPMFIHLGFIHLLFNMMWMYSLGGAIERIQSSLFMLLLILFCELVAGLVQALLPSFLGGNPFGYGASGAVYGVFGYLWMRPRFDSAYPYRLTTNTIYLMIGWLFLCMTGMLGPIGNGAHVGGLLAGMAFAPVWCRLTLR